MPTFHITAPTGETYEINAPQGATMDQAISYAQTLHAKAAPKAAPATQPKPGFWRSLGDTAMTVERALPGVSELGASMDGGLHTAADMLTGKVRVDPNDPRGSLDRINAAAFAASRARQQGMVDELRTNHPVVSNLATGVGYAGQALAALGTGGESAAPEVSADIAAGGRAALARFAKRTALAAPKNATLGASYAAANAASQPGDVADRIQRANAAMIPGAALGVAVPAGIDALSGLARHTIVPAATRALAPVLDPIMSGFAPQDAAIAARATMTTPEARAAQAIKNAIDRDAAAGHVIDPTRPLRLAGGENVAALYDVVAKSPGPGRQMMRDAIDQHRVATSGAIRADIGSALGGTGDYFATQAKLASDRAAAVKPLMDDAFAQPIGTEAFDQNFAPLMGRLPKGALAAARDIARREGRNPDELGLTMLEGFDGRAGSGAASDASMEAHAGAPNVGMTPNVQADAVTPTLETMHYVKKGIDQTLEQYRNPVTGRLDLTGSPGAQADANVRGLLGKAMRKVSPSYDKAMASWGDDSDNIAALKLGRNVFSNAFDMQSEQLGQLHSAMSDESKAQFQKGVGEAIIAEVRKSGGDIRTINRLMGDSADEFRSRIELAFNGDPVAYGKFIESMNGRAADAARDARYRGGSSTYGTAAARADLEAADPHPLDVAADVVGNHPARLAGKALAGILRMLPRNAQQSAIMDPHANAALGRSATDPDEVTRLLNMLQVKRRVSAAPQLQGQLAGPVGRIAAARQGAGQ